MGTTTRFSYGDALEISDSGCGYNEIGDQYMWWCGNNAPDETTEVGLKLPNPWGCSICTEMYGNGVMIGGKILTIEERSFIQRVRMMALYVWLREEIGSHTPRDADLHFTTPGGRKQHIFYRLSCCIVEISMTQFASYPLRVLSGSNYAFSGKSDLVTAIKGRIRMCQFQYGSHLPYIINQEIPADILVEDSLHETDPRFPHNNKGNQHIDKSSRSTQLYHWNKFKRQSPKNPEFHKYSETGLKIPVYKFREQSHAHISNQPRDEGRYFSGMFEYH